jgi:hypothetical protein
VITSIKGSIDCGNQTPGTATITVTGDSPEGRFEASKLDPAVVECYFASGQVIVLGIARAGATKVLLLVSVGTDGVGVEEELRPSGQRRYASHAGTGILTSNGAHASGDVVEKNATPPHTLHVEGDAVCGTSVTGR